MDRRAAKELLHIQGWLERVDEILARGMKAYLGDALLQEAGDSLMMKLGEAANRLSKLDVLAVTSTRPVVPIASPDAPSACLTHLSPASNSCLPHDLATSS